jgi:curved DNA-binding protein CbpA
MALVNVFRAVLFALLAACVVIAQANFDPYEILNVARDASQQEIRKSYRKLALKFHPDKNPKGTKKFLEVTKAYEILGNEDKRSAFDENGAPADSSQPFTGSDADAWSTYWHKSDDMKVLSSMGDHDTLLLPEKRGDQVQCRCISNYMLDTVRIFVVKHTNETCACINTFRYGS